MGLRGNMPLLLLLPITVGIAACGSTGTASGSPPVIVHSEDRGETISVQRGQRLVLLLGNQRSSAAAVGTWILDTYPRPALIVVSQDARHGRFEFEARTVGGGRIVAFLSQTAVRCATPGSKACQIPSGPGLFPPRSGPFVLFVRVIG